MSEPPEAPPSSKNKAPPPDTVPLVEAPLPTKKAQATASSTKAMPRFHLVSWHSQFYWCVWKNCLLLSRRPIMLFIVLFSSVFAMLLSWVSGRDLKDNDAIYPSLEDYSDCGSVRPEFINSLSYEDQTKVQLTLNEHWRDGGEVAHMGLGSMVLAMFAFVVLNGELTAQLLGVLRALGLRDSVYWLSWYTPFASISFFNSLLGAITAQLLPGHVYENVFFFGTFASLFFLNLSLISASFFLAAVCGTSRKLCSNIALLIMIVTAFIPLFVNRASSNLPYPGVWSTFMSSPSGLFWEYTSTEGATLVFETPTDDQWWNNTGNNTFDFQPNSTLTYCDVPILSEFQGTFFKTVEERGGVEAEDIFVGCYTRASWSFRMWNTKSPVGRIIMAFIPYFHFTNIWSSFVGFTSMPNRKFTFDQLSLSQEDLATDALPAPPNPNGGHNSSFAEQGSMFITMEAWNKDYSMETSVCPLTPRPDFPQFCESLDFCGYVEDRARPGDGPSSVLDTMGICAALSVFYLLLAGYWAAVFSRGNGKGNPFYFFLLPGYWCCNKIEPTSDTNGEFQGVSIENISKSYRRVEALKGVSFKMNPGEVTALLGHNGAGKTTLSSILCCETPASGGDIRVFGYSVSEQSFLVRSMVGLCKQDDYLWPNLSGKEHLELFAGLRGVDSSSLGETVQKWLASVDLDEAQNQYSGAYSGGMKRRLSLALATIGDRPLIVLDEPTTGMDPVSRRFIWRHIDAIKEGRVILLTTHAMEEADLLADEVAIMRRGELAAFGSPLQLKTEHGSALQFSLLIDKTKVPEVHQFIQDFFGDSGKWVTIDSSDAGTIIVKISALRDSSNDDGIEVTKLTDFVHWLDSDGSPVSEYGFSNSSLEEVFLKVTEGDGEAEHHSAQVQAHQATAQTDEENIQVVEGSFDRLSRCPSSLSSRNQAFVILRFLLMRGWTGRSSTGNYIAFGILSAGSTLVMFQVSSGFNPLPYLPLVIFAMSIILIAIIGPVYSDRVEGQLYLMRSQGLLPGGYLCGLCLYAFTVQLIYNLLTLGGVFSSPFFRDVVLCDSEKEGENCYWTHFGQRQVETFPTQLRFEDEYNGVPVAVSAIRAPGGYGMVLGIAIASALPTIGYTLCTAFFPGYRFPLVMIMFSTLVVSILPLLPVFLLRSDDFNYDCSNSTNPDFVCSDSIFSRDSIDAQFVDCAGFEVNSYTINAYCVTPAVSLLSHFGIYEMLTMAYTSKITFVSEPEGYVRDILIPSLDGEVRCKDDTCSFPFANRLYFLHLLSTVAGGILFILVGLCLAYSLGFPIAPILRFRQFIGRLVGGCRFSRQKYESKAKDADDATELPEVSEERAIVEEIVKPLLTGEIVEGRPTFNPSAVPREDIEPVITHKLRKVYPALGGRPPKVALESLDLHVQKGEVLGLLGRNGAGKTTALKILAGAHDSSEGLGLVAGYDCDVERISVFERLGNCAQFDVVWSNQSVQRHLEFFAHLKGLPRTEIKTIAREVANAVGLGSNEVYAREAGKLSGGMRRRLSIGMALIGSPSVVILDEPTTGLDPSTRSSIWSLISSFASKERSIIITTHMMIEADTLCSRIAIVAGGKLKVVGNQQHLKSKFGDGYILQLNLVHSAPEHQERAMNFVRKYLHADASLGIRQAKTLHVNLPRDIQLERVFQALYSEKRTSEGGINQFLLSQSSLEDVFISLGE